jgi:hypothetical protein
VEANFQHLVFLDKPLLADRPGTIDFRNYFG